jgi:hypothetical protein
MNIIIKGILGTIICAIFTIEKIFEINSITEVKKLKIGVKNGITKDIKAKG